MKRVWVIGLLGLFAVGEAAHASVTNGDFETGTLSGWNLYGQGTTKTAAFGIIPPDGTYDGFIDTTGNFTQLASTIVPAMGITPSTIAGFGAGAPTNGTGMNQIITVSAGDVLTFKWNFISDELNETATFNDFAFYSIDSTAYFLASRNASTFDMTAPPAGYDGQTGWATQTFSFPAAGSYTLGFGTFNVGDSGHDSALLLDSISVPEPTAMWVMPIALGAIILRKRKPI